MRGLLLLLAAAFLWSTGGFLIKMVDVSGMAVSSGRSLIAVFTLMALARRVPLRPSLPVLRSGLFYALTVTTFVIATKLTTAANAIVLQYAAPVYVALLSAHFLGERVTPRDWVAIILVLLGMGIFFADGISVGNNAGNIFGIISGVCFASLVVSLRQLRERNPVDAVIVGNCLAFVFGAPWLFESSWNLPSAIGVILLGLFQLGLSYYLYTQAIVHVTALEAVLIPVVEPILNPVWVYFGMGEVPSIWAMCGGALVLSAVTWRALGSRRVKKASSDSLSPSTLTAS
jgi:drug/metabolite transporter (DMT)-like permease